MNTGTPRTLDEMLEQLALGTQTKKNIKAALKDFLGNKLNSYSMAGDERQEKLVLEIYQTLIGDRKDVA